MADEIANAANQLINTTQPIPLRGLKLRGVKKTTEITCVKKGIGANGEDVYLKVREEDYDKELHGEKVNKIPSRKKRKKKVVINTSKEEVAETKGE